jgi:hypothetical protein
MVDRKIIKQKWEIPNMQQNQRTQASARRAQQF